MISSTKYESGLNEGHISFRMLNQSLGFPLNIQCVLLNKPEHVAHWKGKMYHMDHVWIWKFNVILRISIHLGSLPFVMWRTSDFLIETNNDVKYWLSHKRGHIIAYIMVQSF